MKAIDAVKEALQDLATEARATGAKKYFKTGEGQYGEGDVFIGVTVPDTRKVVAEYFKKNFFTRNRRTAAKQHTRTQAGCTFNTGGKI